VKTEETGQTAASTTVTSLVPRPPAESTTSLASVPRAEKVINTISGVTNDASVNGNHPNGVMSNIKNSTLEDTKVKIIKAKEVVLHQGAAVVGGTKDLTASLKISSKPQSEKLEKKKKEKNKKQGTKKVRKEGTVIGKKGEEGPPDMTAGGLGDDGDSVSASKKPGSKKGKKKKDDITAKKKKNVEKLTPAQTAVKDMMRQLLEEDKYSVQGSIVDTDSSDEEEDEYAVYAVSGGTGFHKRGMYSEEDATLIHLDRSVIFRAARKRLRVEGMKGMIDMSSNRKRVSNVVIMEDTDIGNQMTGGDTADDSSARRGRKKKKKKGKRNHQGLDDMESFEVISNNEESQVTDPTAGHVNGTDEQGDEVMGIDESSIFGQTTGSSNATWVECDKCKKWRRLRGIVDAKKLPPKWYCTMNKNDPERARCSAPEEEYETPVTPETISDQRARKHLRLWVRRLQCNENFEARLPTMTRGKRRNATNPKDPYEWIRCCNPSCGKWRAVLRSMDASSVIDVARNGEWYCVLNTWDEKTASCAAPQENLPAIGCPPWVMQNDD